MIWKKIVNQVICVFLMLMLAHLIDCVLLTKIVGRENLRVNDLFSLRCSVDDYAANILIDDPNSNRVLCTPPGFFPPSCSGAAGFIPNATEKTVTLEKNASLADRGIWTCTYDGFSPISSSYNVTVIKLDKIPALQTNIVLQSSASSGSKIDKTSNDTFTVFFGCISEKVRIMWELTPSSLPWSTGTTSSLQYPCITDTQLYSHTLLASDGFAHLKSGTGSLMVRIFYSSEELAVGDFNVTFDAGQKFCQVPDIKRRNLERGITDMSTDDTGCKTVCPVTVVITELFILIASCIVYQKYYVIWSNYQWFIYFAIHSAIIISAGIISGLIVTYCFRENGHSGYCCEENVVMQSAIIPETLIIGCIVVIVVYIVITEYCIYNIRHNHKKKTIRTCCAQLTCKVTPEELCRSGEQPPGATDLQTPTRVSPTAIIVTAAGSLGKKGLPPIQKPKAVTNNSANQNHQPTEQPKTSIVQTSVDIKELKPKSKKNKPRKNINQQQQQTTSENTSNENLEKTTINQTNENSLPLNQTINKQTSDGDIGRDEREKKKGKQQTNEKHELSSQKTETDMTPNANSKSQKILKPHEMADDVVQTSHKQKQQTNTESKKNENHKTVTSEIQHDKITHTAFENQERGKHIAVDDGKNDQINLGKEAEQIIQNNDSIKVSEINSIIDEMANKNGTTAHEQKHSFGQRELHEKQDKAIQNHPNAVNMPDETGDEKEKGKMQINQ